MVPVKENTMNWLLFLCLICGACPALPLFAVVFVVVTTSEVVKGVYGLIKKLLAPPPRTLLDERAAVLQREIEVLEDRRHQLEQQLFDVEVQRGAVLDGDPYRTPPLLALLKKPKTGPT